MAAVILQGGDQLRDYLDVSVSVWVVKAHGADEGWQEQCFECTTLDLKNHQ